MSTIRYSAATGGFYDIRIHAKIPADAVAVSAASHQRLMRAQADGARIVSRGRRPSIARPSGDPIDFQRAGAIAAINAEARARILSIASLARQSNDNAALAIAALAGALSDEAAAALDRRTRIEAVRAAAATARAYVATADAESLAAFSVRATVAWPVETDR